MKYYNRGYSWGCGNWRANGDTFLLGKTEEEINEWVAQEVVRQSYRKDVSLEKEEETAFRAHGLSKWVVQIQEIANFSYWVYTTSALIRKLWHLKVAKSLVFGFFVL